MRRSVGALFSMRITVSGTVTPASPRAKTLRRNARLSLTALSPTPMTISRGRMPALSAGPSLRVLSISSP